MRTQVQTQQPAERKMKSFNKTINIQIEVDSIAQRLLDTIDPLFKHRDILAEAIIGTAVNNNTIGYVYNALAGFTNDIDFQVGEIINCTEKERRVNTFAAIAEGEAPIFNNCEDVQIGECEIVDINLYSSNKLKVKFLQHKWKSEDTEEREVWVDHKRCSHYPQQQMKVEVVETR